MLAASLAEIKMDLKSIIRANSDRGFVPYSGCNRVCHAMENMLEGSLRLEERESTVEVHLYILTEAIKLIDHADTSSGAVTDVVLNSLNGIGEISQSASSDQRNNLFKAIIKTAKHKAFKGWEEYAYHLLRCTVVLVQDHKQAQAVYDLFPILGTMYGGQEYPDRYMITQGIIERLEGKEAVEQYRMAHIDIPEIRTIVVEQALADCHYELAEKLCQEALIGDQAFREAPVWVYYLERIYAEQANVEKRIEMMEKILLRGNRSYYAKLKNLYLAEGGWEQKRDVILERLSEKYLPHVYAALLDEEGEYERLLDVVQAHPILIEYYGKQLAKHFPEKTYRIYDSYIVNEAAQAANRGQYKGVCRLIKSYYTAGAERDARELIHRLIENYPRRVAMVDELGKLQAKWAK